jgi:hypothetical protein
MSKKTKKEKKKATTEEKEATEKFLSTNVARFIEESSIFLDVERLIAEEIEENIDFLISIQSISKAPEEKEKLVIDKIESVFLLCRYRNAYIQRLYTGALYETFLTKLSDEDKKEMRLKSDMHFNEFYDKPNEFYVASHFFINGEINGYLKDFKLELSDFKKYMESINKGNYVEVFDLRSTELLNVRTEDRVPWKNVAEKINSKQDFVVIKSVNVKEVTTNEKFDALTKIKLKFNTSEETQSEPIEIVYSFEKAASISNDLFIKSSEKKMNEKEIMHNNNSNNNNNKLGNKNDNKKRSFSVKFNQLKKKTKFFEINSDDNDEEKIENKNYHDSTTSLSETMSSNSKKLITATTYNNTYNNNDKVDEESSIFNQNIHSNLKKKNDDLDDCDFNDNSDDDDDDHSKNNSYNNINKYNNKNVFEDIDFSFKFDQKSNNRTNFTRIKHLANEMEKETDKLIQIKLLAVEFIIDKFSDIKKNNNEIKQFIFEIFCDQFNEEEIFTKSKTQFGESTALLGDYPIKHKKKVNSFFKELKTDKKNRDSLTYEISIAHEAFYKGFILTFYRISDFKRMKYRERFNMNDFSDNRLGYFVSGSKIGEFINKLTIEDMSSLIVVFLEKLKKEPKIGFTKTAKIDNFRAMTEEILNPNNYKNSLSFVRAAKTVIEKDTTGDIKIINKKDRDKKKGRKRKKRKGRKRKKRKGRKREK